MGACVWKDVRGCGREGGQLQVLCLSVELLCAEVFPLFLFDILFLCFELCSSVSLVFQRQRE